jgi:hypothetical protein
MTGDSAELELLARKLDEQARKLRKRNVILYAFPIVAAVFLLYSSTVERWYSSLKYGVPFGQAELAKEQSELWQRNYNCINSSVPATWLQLERGIQLSAWACPSGDILIGIRKKDRGPETYYRWLRDTNLIEKPTA